MLQLCKRIAFQRKFCLRLLSNGNAVSVLDAYKRHIVKNNLHSDEKQLTIVKLLDRLRNAVEKFDIHQFGDKTTLGTTYPEKPLTESQNIGRMRGLYIYGPVGVGKTMVMDMFYNSCHLEQKRRVHFHQFMLNVHRLIHYHKQYLLVKFGRSRHVDLSPEHDSIRQVGYQIAAETKLLCFDEFQVTDICDALILTKLFDAMWSRGVVLVATSNRPPTDLYLDGINRPDFLPFIERLQMECIVRKLDSGKDYRLLGYEKHKQDQHKLTNSHESRFMAPITASNIVKFRTAFVQEVNNRRETGTYAASNTIAASEVDANNSNIIRLPIQGNRYFSITKQDVALDVGVCYIDFATLCETDRGAVDYHALCQYFQVAYINGIPKLTRKQHDATRRFIILIDELYNHRVKLVCLAEANSPHEMYSTFTQPLLSEEEADESDSEELESNRNSNSCSRPQVGALETTEGPGQTYGRNHSMPTARLKEVNTIGQQEEVNVMESELSSIKDLDFAFQRATSRVMEMITWQ